MKGWLVVNGFLKTDKFNEIYLMLKNACEKENMQIEIKYSNELIYCTTEVFSVPDFVIFWDKDVFLASHLEKLGVPVFNSSKAIEICDNKILTCLALNEHNIAHPTTVVSPLTFEGIGYNNLDFVKFTGRKLGFPLIIKEAYGSFGKQVYMAKDENEAIKIVKKLGHKQFLMQKFISESCGKDVRINVVGNKVVGAMLRYNDNDFRSNISNGGSSMVYEPTEEQKDIAIRASQACGADFAGVDVLLSQNPIVCEVNSNPHFKSLLQCTGKDISIDIVKYIKEKLNERASNIR